MLCCPNVGNIQNTKLQFLHFFLFRLGFLLPSRGFWMRPQGGLGTGMGGATFGLSCVLRDLEKYKNREASSQLTLRGRASLSV